MIKLPVHKMSEAEVSLRLAFGLIESGKTESDVEVAIDGAQVRTRDTVHFPIDGFLTAAGWILAGDGDTWRGRYYNQKFSHGISVHSRSGYGDVVVQLVDGRTLRAESKKGPLVQSRSSAEYPLIREALGQLLTIEVADPTDILAVAVPASPKFESLARAWRSRPLIVRSGIHIATISRDGSIRGLEGAGIRLQR